MRFSLLTSVLVLTVTLTAQSTAPSGSYGFLAIGHQADSAGETGGAVLGVMKIDGAGT